MNPLVVSGILDIGRGIISRIFPDPQERAKAELELLKMEQSGELTEMATRIDVIKAEASSDDPWTSRARPMFLYTFYVVLLSLVVVAPVVGVVFPEQMGSFFLNVGRGFQAIPEELWTTFTLGFLGYATARSYEKAKGVAK